MKAAYSAALAILVSATTAAKDETTFAVLRFTNKQLTKGRADPIVFSGQTSSHVHTIMGGSAFGLASTGEDLLGSKCSNAQVKGDNSNYWFPSLYFRDPNDGTFEPVEINYVNAYYFFEKSNDDIKAFPVGMSMVSGNGSTRVMPKGGADGNLDPSKGPVNPARFTCPRSNQNYSPPSWPTDSDGTKAGVGNTINKGEGCGFPDVHCDGLYSPLRADVHFPSCYNPNAGLTSYTNNMAWPEDNGNGGKDCPKGWTHVPHLFLEVYWSTDKFKDRWTQGQGKQPFVLSNGDITGFSSHADFMAGWDEKLLQHIIDTCNAGTKGMDNCSGLTYGLNEGDCTIDSPVDEKIDGVLKELPGKNPVQGWWFGLDKLVPDVGGPVPTKGNDSTPKPTTTGQTSAGGDETQKEENSSSAKPGYSAPSTLDNVHKDSPDITVTSIAQAADKTEAPSRLDTKSTRSTCIRKTRTVWYTVTVTASDSAIPSGESHKRRHMHHHARRHGSLHR